jgi:putative oxidoreductase
MKNFFLRCFVDWPAGIGARLAWLAPLFARIVVGWIFLWRGWSDVHASRITAEFGQWGMAHAKYLTPVISGVELAGGIFLLLGFITRFSAFALAAIMILLLVLVHRSVFHSLTDFVNLRETQYLALFLWLAVGGGGALALDNLIHKPKG